MWRRRRKWMRSSDRGVKKIKIVEGRKEGKNMEMI